MDLDEIKKALSTKLSPDIQKNGEFKLASVLVLIYGKDPKILMIEKHQQLTIHAGEIAFPGGKLSKKDKDLLDTALRETREEVGLELSRNDVIGQLENVRTLNSRFMITPFVACLENIEKITPSPEVETVLKIPLVPFLQTLEDDPDPEHNVIKEMYIFKHFDNVVWGASARILKQIVNRLDI